MRESDRPSRPSFPRVYEVCETCGYDHVVDYPALTEEARAEAEARHSAPAPRLWTSEVYSAASG